MKLQPSSKKEIKRIAIGTLACDGIMIAGLFLLSQFGVGSFDFMRILLGAVCGSIVSVANFTILCLTIQSAVEIENKRKMKAHFQLSYNLRLVLQALWVVAAFVIPQIHFVAGAAPVLFPNITMIYLQTKGKLVTPSESPAPSSQEEEPEDHLGSFEV
ncbi:MAG: ATP synthase subunit I [Oscillospiraceae bacterium]|nr:ATP synthase subunit I [Oscillospiraceae bacterium]